MDYGASVFRRDLRVHLGMGEMARIVHFVGFRDDRYWNAVKAFGAPHYVHIGWDMRARREIDENDLIVFADGPHDQDARVKSYPDMIETDLDRGDVSLKALRTRRHRQR